MKYRTLGCTGAQISAVSLGGAYLARDNPKSSVDSARAVVQSTFELSINYIDTAPLYSNSEERLGHALEGQTQPFYLSTRVGFDPQDFDYRGDSDPAPALLGA